MGGKLLYYIEDRFIKSVVLKKLYEKGLEFIEILDDRDLYLKLEIFKETILFFIVQINEGSYREQYEMIKCIKQEADFSNFPVMAIIPKDTAEFVSGAKEAGVDDVVLIPEKRELFRDFFTNRFDEFLKKIPENKGIFPNIDEIKKSILTTLSSNQDLKKEIKRATRGKYSVCFVMGRITGIHIGMIQEFYDKLKNELRETDNVINNDYRTFIVVCPFTEKEHIIEIEKKIRRTFEEMFGGYTRFRRLHMYGVAYPEDGSGAEKLMDNMEKGIHDSIIISGINEPLNMLSRERLEEYRNMLRLYK